MEGVRNGSIFTIKKKAQWQVVWTRGVGLPALARRWFTKNKLLCGGRSLPTSQSERAGEMNLWTVRRATPHGRRMEKESHIACHIASVITPATPTSAERSIRCVLRRFAQGPRQRLRLDTYQGRYSPLQSPIQGGLVTCLFCQRAGG